MSLLRIRSRKLLVMLYWRTNICRAREGWYVMPQLTVRGIGQEQLAAISKPLVEELARICETTVDNFTIDRLTVDSVFDGHPAATYPFIEVAWFDRGREARNRFAEATTRRLREAGVLEVEIAFKAYAPDAYYINGEPCD